MRRAYTLLWWLALPWLPLRLWWRGRREPGYRDAIGERFGRYRHAERPRGDMLWIHAVSLGETRAAVPLVQRILRERPDASILLTHMTASGRSAGRSLFGDRVVQAWLPYDLPFAVERFLAHFTPRAGLLMETELWPNLVRVAAKRNVPLFLVNGRLSERSARGYLRVAGIAGPMLRSLAGVAAQTVDDAKRLAAIGAQDLVVTGNLKFDVDVPPAMLERGRVLRDRFGRDRRVLVLASTRDGEESLLLDAMQRAALAPQTLVVIVPRHPQRFDDVASLLARRNVAFVRRSEDRDVADDVRVVLGDSMGEMFAYYAAADVVFVGGSLLPLGGQNLIEPIAVGVPTLIGPHMFNFAQAAEAAVAAGAAARVRDAGEVFAIAERLLDDAAARRAMGERAARFIAEHRGATERLWQWLAPRIGDGAAGPSNIDRSRIEVSP